MGYYAKDSRVSNSSVPQWDMRGINQSVAGLSKLAADIQTREDNIRTANRTYDMEKQSMSDTANYRLQQQSNDIKKAEMLKAYQDRVAKGIEGERLRKNQMEEGMIAAGNFDIATTKDGQAVPTSKLDQNALKALTNEIVSRPSDVPQTKDAIDSAYDEYIWANSPEQPEQPEKRRFAPNDMFNELMYKGTSALTGKPIMNRAQFQDKLKNDQRVVNEYLSTQAADVASNPKLLREKGILTSSTSAPQVAMSGKEHIAAGNKQIKEYAKKYKLSHDGENMPKYLKLGMQKQLAAEGKAIDSDILLARTNETKRKQDLVDYDTKQRIKAKNTTKSAKGIATEMAAAKANYDIDVKELKRQWDAETNFLNISGTSDSEKTKKIKELKNVLLKAQARIQKKYD